MHREIISAKNWNREYLAQRFFHVYGILRNGMEAVQNAERKSFNNNNWLYN